MILFNIENTCTDAGMANITVICKNILNIIHIIGPILCIIALVVIFTKILINPEDKKYKKRIINSVLALIILFMVPYIVNAFMYMLGSNINLSNCWNNSEEVFTSNKPTYIEISNKKKGLITGSSSDYEPGEEREVINPEGGNTGSSSYSGTDTYTGKGLGAVQSIKITYNVKDSKGRCGKGSRDKCSEVAVVQYRDKTVTYYMGYQNNSGLLGGSCRAHAFTCGMNVVNDSYYSTMDLQNYMRTIDGNGVFKGKKKYNSAINYFNVPAKAYFEETSINESYVLAKEALANGQPVMIFVAHNKCSDLAGSHHALLLLGYDTKGNVIFLDSCSRYPHAKKRNLEQLILGCMSGESIARNWMRMVIFSFR